jgi:hypothetical protein
MSASRGYYKNLKYDDLCSLIAEYKRLSIRFAYNEKNESKLDMTGVYMSHNEVKLGLTSFIERLKQLKHSQDPSLRKGKKRASLKKKT